MERQNDCDFCIDFDIFETDCNTRYLWKPITMTDHVSYFFSFSWIRRKRFHRLWYHLIPRIRKYPLQNQTTENSFQYRQSHPLDILLDWRHHYLLLSEQTLHFRPLWIHHHLQRMKFSSLYYSSGRGVFGRRYNDFRICAEIFQAD